MVVRIDAEVLNIKELERDLNKLRRKDIAVNLNRIAKQVMEPLVTEAKQAAPVRSGRLRNSIRHRRQRGRLVMQVGGPKAHHARFVLGGWSRGNTTVAPNMFLRDAISRQNRQILDRYQRATRQLFDQIDRTYGKRR